MTRQRTRRALRFALLALAAGLWATSAAADEAPAEPTPTATATPTPTPPPEPIPLARVAAEAEAAERAARNLAALSQPEAAIVEIEGLLAEREAGVAERIVRARALAADPPSLVALEEEAKGFDLAGEQIGSYVAQLTDRLTVLETSIAEVTRQRAVWNATETTATEAGAPPAVVREIRDTGQALRDAKRHLETRRGELLALQARLAEYEQRVLETLDSLTAAQASFRSQLLLRDSPPIWSAARAEGREVAEGIAETWSSRWRALVNFLRLRTERLWSQAALLLLAVVATVTLKRRASGWRADDPRLEASSVIFERPLSAALLIGVGLTPLLHPRAPRLAQAIQVALVALPAVRLLPRLLEPTLAPAVYALAGFALLDSVRDVFAKAVLVERSLLWLETVAALAFLVWMLRPARLRELSPGTRVSRWLRPLLRASAVALAIAAVASPLGWMNLARTLSDGVLGTGYAALVIYGGARILRTLLRAALRSGLARRLGIVRRHGHQVSTWSRRIIDFAGWFAWLYFSFSAFGIADATAGGIRSLLGAEASFGAIEISLGDLLAFVLTIAGALVLSRLLRTILEDDVLPRVPSARGVPLAVTSTVHYLVLFLGFLLAISAAGVDLNRVSLLAGAFGVGIGFGLQNVVNNFVSGLILLYERPIQLGDVVEVGGAMGEVKRIGIRSSTIRTLQGAEVIVPNGNLISDQVVNWTFSDRLRRIEVKVGVAYGTDPERVLALLREVAAAHPDVLESPEPVALFLGFGDSSLDFELRTWTGLFENWVRTQSELTVAVNRAIVDAGIEIPFPQRDLHLRSADAKTFGALRDDGE